MLRSVGFVLRPYSKPATPLVRTAGVAVGRRRLHGSYTTAGTAAALWFQPVVSETVARSLKAAGFLGVAPGSWDFRRMESCAIRLIIARRTGVGNSLVEVLSGVVRPALIAGVG